ncbi:MAG: protein kinase, partial [Acidobacteriota bacterium]
MSKPLPPPPPPPPPPPTTSASAAPPRPRQIGPYRLGKLLGKGGMGEVFQAFDERLDRAVAVKRLRMDPTAIDRRRFRREARILAKLGHPAIVQIFDIVEDDAGDWIVMEFIDGPTLAKMRRQSALDVSLVLDYARQIASALDAAHARDIVHRDLKSENVMVLPSGYVKVLDFGLARRYALGDGGGAELDSGISHANRIVGTPRAMSPEQIAGHHLDARSDLFSMGILLYELLTTISPFRGDGVGDTIQRVITHIPPSVHTVRSEVPPALSQLIDQMLAKEPAHRPQSASDVAQAIRAIHPDAPATPRPPSDLQQIDTFDGERSRVSGLLDSKGAVGTPSRYLGERRQVTVLCCDVRMPHRRTGALEAPDPETLIEVLPALRAHVEACVERFDGTVDHTIQQHRVVAYFGYPIAHEDDAARAVRAALALIDPPAAAFAKLALRVGVHTGAAVIAAPSSSGAAGGSESPGSAPSLIAGGTLDTAGAMLALATRDQVVLSAATRRLVRQSFAVEPIASPDGHVGGWRATSALDPLRADVDSSIEGLPMIARGLELELLRSRWQLVAGGRGQVVLVTGEAGIGKSRLVSAFRGALRGDEQPRWWTAYGSPFLQNSPLAPIITLLGREVLGRAHIDQPGGDDDERARLDAFLQRYDLPRDEMRALLGALLNLQHTADPSAAPISPDVQRKKTLDALVALLLEMADEEPWVLMIEDLHWVDPSTLELLDRVVEHAPSTGLFLLATSRPHGEAIWHHGASLTRIQIENLTAAEGEALIDRVAAGRALPPDLRSQILERTDGVPLFIEELTQAILEANLESDSFMIPATLRDSLTARLDRLGSAKEIAQMASVIGRSFTLNVLAAAAGDELAGDITLQPDVDRLVTAGLLYCKGFGPSRTYTFKHALIQDIAYDSLLRKDRETLHRRVGDVMARQMREPKTSARAEIVAHHYTEAGAPAEAVPHWVQAGHEAMGRSAYREAIEHLRMAQIELMQLPESPARDLDELQIHTALGLALHVVSGYTHPEVERSFTRALDLIDGVDDLGQQIATLWGIYALHSTGGRLHTAREITDRMVDLVSANETRATQADEAARARHNALACSARVARGTVHRFLGALHEASSCYEKALMRYPADAPAQPAVQLQVDPRVLGLA